MASTIHEHDVLIVGGGGAGLRAAIAADEEGADVAIVSKLHPVRSHTGAAEGGINAVLDDEDSIEDHAYETMKGSDYLADAPAAETLCKESPKETIQLEHWGMGFSRDDDGSISQRPFGGMEFPRTAYAGAETGHHMLHTLYQQVVKRGVEVYDEWYVTRLAVTDHDDPDERACHGFVAMDIRSGDLAGFQARQGVILATGGAGQVYEHTTNAIANTGDGHAMAYRAGVPLEDMEFIQFHPTTLASTGVLVTEGVRGEGGILWNADGERFMFERGYATTFGELASRDVVSRAELTEVNEGRGVKDDHVYLDMRHLGEERILDRLENIVHLAEDFEGANALEEPMPVKPGAHFTMGGIETNEKGETAIDGLYAAGECACASTHGANRLGGNSLPVTLVYGKIAGRNAAGGDVGDPGVEVGYTDDVEEGTVETPVGLGEPDSAGDAAADGAAVGTQETVEGALEAEQRRIEMLMDREDGVHHSTIREELQETMSQHVSVFREEDGLKQALQDIREAREQYRDVVVEDPSSTYNTDLIHTIETRNLLDMAEAITAGALVRTESRGAHWRKAHQDRDDENWLKHTLVAWNDGDPEIYFKPVVLEGEFGEYEPKARSY
jgi:succinate dehydrogenase / fumarate reductase flavoprotein subunit